MGISIEGNSFLAVSSAAPAVPQPKAAAQPQADAAALQLKATPRPQVAAPQPQAKAGPQPHVDATPVSTAEALLGSLGLGTKLNATG